MKVSLRVKLSAAFVAVTLLLFLIVAVLANGLLESRFTAYVIEKQQQKISDTVVLLPTQYNEQAGVWDASAIEAIGMNALGDGLILRVEDPSGNAVWDAMAHNSGMCAALLKNMAGNMQNFSPRFQGGYSEEQHPLHVNGVAVGMAKFGYYGPYFFNDNELQFLTTLNRLLVWAASASALASLAFGVFMARQLTRPIGQVIRAAGRIARGDFTSRVQQRSTTREIVDLTATVNRLAETLGRQDELRQRLTADVAHELRTPLTTLQSHLEAMLDGIWQPDAQRLASCHEEVIRLSKLVGDIEELAHFEGENLVLERKRVDLSILLGRIVTNFENQFRQAGIALVYKPEGILLYADEDKLIQVFFNLLSNALKYTPAGGSVTIFARVEADRAIVCVQDTGIGISVEELPHIFERFYRTDKSRSRQTGGAGIGLTIARSIVYAHGGSIDVMSEPGKGSRFTVTLPANASAGDACR